MSSWHPARESPGGERITSRTTAESCFLLCLRLQREPNVRSWGVDSRGRGTRGGEVRVEGVEVACALRVSSAENLVHREAKVRERGRREELAPPADVLLPVAPPRRIEKDLDRVSLAIHDPDLGDACSGIQGELSAAVVPERRVGGRARIVPHDWDQPEHNSSTAWRPAVPGLCGVVPSRKPAAARLDGRPDLPRSNGILRPIEDEV